VGPFLIGIVNLAFEIFSLLILARIVVSWLNLNPYNPIVQFLHNTTEPILAPVRRLLPATGMIDFSPMVVLIAALILQRVVVQILANLLF
jgi:YggT family protein